MGTTKDTTHQETLCAVATSMKARESVPARLLVDPGWNVAVGVKYALVTTAATVTYNRQVHRV